MYKSWKLDQKQSIQYYTRNNKNGKSYASGTAEYLELIAHGKFTSATSLYITPGPQTSQASIKKTIRTHVRTHV
jgi:hypothetical protein